MSPNYSLQRTRPLSSISDCRKLEVPFSNRPIRRDVTLSSKTLGLIAVACSHLFNHGEAHMTYDALTFFFSDEETASRAYHYVEARFEGNVEMRKLNGRAMFPYFLLFRGISPDHPKYKIAWEHITEFGKLDKFYEEKWSVTIPEIDSNSHIVTALPSETLCEDFNCAAKNGDLDKVKILLKDNPTLVSSRAVFFGETPLHAAAGHGHKAVVELLLTKGADVNARDQNKQTPLHDAASNGHRDVVELLLTKGAYVNAKYHNKRTALHDAASNGHRDVVELLLINKADVNAKMDKDSGGETPLFKAAAEGHKEVVELLLAYKADINAQGEWATPLDSAASNGHRDVVELLLVNGADANYKGKWGTPLHRAEAMSHQDVATLLRQHGGHE